MKTIEESKYILQNLGELIFKMNNEINKLRNINYRYYLQYGEIINDGVIEVEDELDFILTKENELTICRLDDFKKLNLTSNYMEIKKMLKKLN
jgi:hypothetical protein